jgi:hypothetical protein
VSSKTHRPSSCPSIVSRERYIAHVEPPGRQTCCIVLSIFLSMRQKPWRKHAGRRCSLTTANAYLVRTCPTAQTTAIHHGAESELHQGTNPTCRVCFRSRNCIPTALPESGECIFSVRSYLGCYTSLYRNNVHHSGDLARQVWFQRVVAKGSQTD